MPRFQYLARLPPARSCRRLQAKAQAAGMARSPTTPPLRMEAAVASGDPSVASGAIGASCPAGGGAECDECDQGDEREAAEKCGVVEDSADLFGAVAVEEVGRAE